jgi:phosphoribosylformylglycinamidine cyclo-ligase
MLVNTMDYASSGVNIEAGNKAVELIKSRVQSTHNPFVLSRLGGFAAHMEIPPGYTNPVLVTCTDGVGTKVKLAIESGILDTVGIDLVAMCVNDMICSGATPLCFLDYIACHALVPTQMESLISGMVTGCKQANCALVGGEMAEMNDLYKEGDFDLAGFAVGVVEKSAIIDGSKIAPGHNIYALLSSGIHSNGFSLVRRVLTDEVRAKHNIAIDTLLTPTTIYVTQILDLIATHTITGIAHITGGGLVENISRILPKGTSLDINYSAWEPPSIFRTIQSIGQISDTEMYRVFNMGIGMVVITPETLPETLSLTHIGTIKI